MVPIGIITRDRVAYLDATLRSLSATALPEGISVIVFDDGSKDASTRKYYTTQEVVTVTKPWPTNTVWKKTLGLGMLNTAPQPTGIQNKVQVVTLGARSLGVVTASCQVVCRMFDAYPQAPGIFLLQDDIVFHANWYDRMLDTKDGRFAEKPIGLLAGIKLNKTLRPGVPPPPAVSCGVTAQCLYISRPAFDSTRKSYFERVHKTQQRFDDTLRRAVAGHGFWAGVIFPFVCQHTGIKSLVRPSRTWYRGEKGRVGYYAHPPYAMADAVSKFRGMP